ncbi:MAG: SGNH/GDSL hydrolase family protein [Ruminococcaceae bacterium]|nr:SGNH/GDSL hydrolase family protein [Oscillospiraceae bacterium]
MKKLLSLFLVSVLTLLTFVGCGNEENPSSDTATVSETVTTSEVTSEPTSTSTSSKKASSSSKAQKPSSRVETSSKEEKVVLTELEKIYQGVDPDLYSIGLKNKGNSARIAALMKKAQKGGNYKIAVLGGSISQGASASSVYSSYGNLICEWWSANFPNSDFEFVNAGIGSTNPEMANYRISEDLLKYNPDFVVVDFTVNTYLDYDVNNTYSSILYKILSQKNSPAVMSIDFTSCEKSSYAAATYKKTKDVPVKAITDAVKAYDIPAMSYHEYVWNKISAKVLAWRLGGVEKKSGLSRDIGADYIHPNDNGHMIAANLITCYLKKVMDNLAKESTKITAPQKPETSDYLNLGYVTNTAKGVTLSGGFTAGANSSATSRGWSYNFTSDESVLTIPVPANKSVKVFMSFKDGSSGYISVTDSKGKTKSIDSSAAKTPTLVDIGNMEGKIALTPKLENGGFTIYGIGIKN